MIQTSQDITPKRRRDAAQARAVRVAGAVLVLTLAGCGFKQYAAKPLDADASVAAIEARSLGDPRLAPYFATHGVPAEPWPPTAWDLRALTLAALALNPELDIARAQLVAARAGETTAAMRPNLGFQSRVEHHSDTAGKDSPWSVAVLLDIPIVDHGKRDARIAQAQALSESAHFDVAATAWRVVARVRDRYFEYLVAMRDVAIAESESALRAEEVAMLDRRVELGAASATDLGTARTLQSETAVRLSRAGAQAVQAKAALADAIGVPSTSLDAVEITLEGPAVLGDLPPPRDVQATALLNRMDLQRAIAQYAAAEAGLKLEVARQYPDITLRTGFGWDQGDRIWALGVLGLLALVNRNEGPIAEAEARRELEAARFRALQTRVIGEVQAARARYAAALKAASDAAEVEHQANARTARVERRFDAGSGDRLERTHAHLDALAAVRLRETALAQSATARAALEDAMQVPLGAALDLQRVVEETPAAELVR